MNPMQRPARLFDEDIFESIIEAVTIGALVPDVCVTLDVLPTDVAFWCRAVLGRRSRLDEARALGKLIRQASNTSHRRRRDRESPRTEYQALRALESEPPPA